MGVILEGEVQRLPAGNEADLIADFVYELPMVAGRTTWTGRVAPRFWLNEPGGGRSRLRRTWMSAAATNERRSVGGRLLATSQSPGMRKPALLLFPWVRCTRRRVRTPRRF